MELWNHAGGLDKSVQLNRVKKTKSLTGPLTLAKRIEDKSGGEREGEREERKERFREGEGVVAMNPLTLVKRIQNINSKEAALGISEEASWHAKYKDSAYVFVGGIPFDLTEGDLLAVFAQ